MLVGVGLMTSALTSNAAVYRGSWDPSFGNPYPDLGYRGFADIFVPDACLDGDPISGAWVADGDACSGGGMSLLAATVELFNYTLDPNGPTIDTVVFAPPAVVPDPVLGVFIQFDSNTGRNEVVGADTSTFGPQFGSGPGYSGNLWLEFISGQMPPPILLFETLDVVSNGAFLHACLPDEGEASLCSTPEVTTTNPGTVTFQRIPEPGSIALIFGALAAGWAARRSIRKA
jgi:hypothetical protein